MAAGISAAITQGIVAHNYHSEARHEFLRLPLLLHGFCIPIDAVCEVTSIHQKKSDSPQIILPQNSY